MTFWLTCEVCGKVTTLGDFAFEWEREKHKLKNTAFFHDKKCLDLYVAKAKMNKMEAYF